MIKVHFFVFSPFSENTYILSDETSECIIIDPGCYTEVERKKLTQYIEESKLNPTRLINTHCHIDHVFGNRFVAEKYDLELEIHQAEIPVLNSLSTVAQMYGIPDVQQSPDPAHFIEEGSVIEFGNSQLSVLFTPGHSPGSISFYCKEQQFIISGDVLFEGSIGRTDLPGGDQETLMNSILQQLMPLPDEVIVYSGHGNPTQIGVERKNNPFILNHTQA